MFSADLSWSDHKVERVGQREERKHKERQGSLRSDSSKDTPRPSTRTSTRNNSKTTPKPKASKSSFFFSSRSHSTLDKRSETPDPDAILPAFPNSSSNAKKRTASNLRHAPSDLGSISTTSDFGPIFNSTASLPQRTASLSPNTSPEPVEPAKPSYPHPEEQASHVIEKKPSFTESLLNKTSQTFERKVSLSRKKTVETDPANLKDPTLQPSDWTLSGRLDPVLPSGAPIDRPDDRPQSPLLSGDDNFEHLHSSGLDVFEKAKYRGWPKARADRDERTREANTANSSEVEGRTSSDVERDGRPYRRPSYEYKRTHERRPSWEAKKAHRRGPSIEMIRGVIGRPSKEAAKPTLTTSISSEGRPAEARLPKYEHSEKRTEVDYSMRMGGPEIYVSRSITSSVEVCESERSSVHVTGPEPENEKIDPGRFPQPPSRSPLRFRPQNPQSLKSSYFVDYPLKPLVPRTANQSEIRIPIQGPKLTEPTNWPLSKVSSESHKWQAPSDWEIFPSKKETHKITGSLSSTDGYSPPLSRLITEPTPPTPPPKDPVELTHFQRFVKRMESAGPKIILDRLREQWTEPIDDMTRVELELEKHLWALTALQLESLNKYARSASAASELNVPALSQPRQPRILEIGGNIAELYQLSAIYPTAQIHYLTSSSESTRTSITGRAVSSPSNDQVRHLALPDRITQHTTKLASAAYLAFGSNTFSLIRSSCLPAYLPSSNLPALLKECHRVLEVGGRLELRLVEPLPDRSAVGPQMEEWADDHITLALEQKFRCHRPGQLVPGWVKKAGFTILPAEGAVGKDALVQRRLRLPAAVEDDDVDAQVAMLVGRALWWDVWGGIVEEHDPEFKDDKCWWLNEDILTECEQKGTFWEVGTLIAVKEAP
ncbi:hypothetical protein K402DRAFT_200612 [Aulographum hederae CBS 113979]|uniref:Methyltransferase type 11 domain-containing protein n=1 Tax=Aulographum hederae CBS 113979 TaxID=1176131 RepID=A0A6G1HBQ2_9PEZI|nr:hypothetical protein K402DRAFT_200612 [Aulographum hederae CBS 113979]